jgi:hypothetical protein
MGRVWVLDTETKGTGAQMVPLDKVHKKPAPSAEPFWVPPERSEREPKPVERTPLSFRIVDVVSQSVLADQADAREAVGVLSDVRSVVDVNVFVWQPKAEKWRLLTLDEKRALWEARQADRTTRTATSR